MTEVWSEVWSQELVAELQGTRFGFQESDANRRVPLRAGTG